MQTFSMPGSCEGGQLLKEPEGYSSGSSTHSSPRKSSTSKTSSEVMAMMMIGSVSLEEQVVFLAKSMKMLAASVREKDEQITFMMNKITLKSKFARRRGKYYQGCKRIATKS